MRNETIITEHELKQVYESRPFGFRNADEYDLENILDLFIDPTIGLIGPYDFSNTIIKGKMGAGKTMYLRANYAYYLYTLVPCLMKNLPIILPVYIKLSDFQNIRNTEIIYKSILMRIVEEILSVVNHLSSTEELARLHCGASKSTCTWSSNTDIKKIEAELKLMSADTYVEKVNKSFKAKGSMSYNFIKAFAEYEEAQEQFIKHKKHITFPYLTKTCETLLSPFNGKLLILFDEIGSLSKNFFEEDMNGNSYFETLMNQLRTLPYVRMKLAIYPNTPSDILKETRYGDIVPLDYDIINQPKYYEPLSNKITTLIDSYIQKVSSGKYTLEDVFETADSNTPPIIEQLINATSGNMRRLIHLLDSAMNEAYKDHLGTQRVSLQNVFDALKQQGSEMESLFQSEDVNFLINLSKLCKARNTYKFTYSGQGQLLQNFTNNSEEYNIIEVEQFGPGKKSNVYYFDYAYCIYKDLPTHYIKETKKIDINRSRTTGEPIRKLAQLTDELILQSAVPGKIYGTITYLDDYKTFGSIKGNNGTEYSFTLGFIISSDRQKMLLLNATVRFLPNVLEDILIATEIEILD